MKHHKVDQGSAEWYNARLGVPTASNFHKILTPTGKASTQASCYMYRLIAEKLLRDTMDDQIGHVQWVEHGLMEEPHAAQQFEFITELQLEPAGFITTDDDRLGCTPDRLVKGRNEAVEIKCKSPPLQIGYLLDGPGNDYRPQVQGQLLVGEFDKVHFYAYHPRMPAFHDITRRDEPYLKLLGPALQAFLQVLEEKTEKARRLGAYVATEHISPMLRAYPELEPDPLQIILP